jgi:ankyrin repeat protein
MAAQNSKRDVYESDTVTYLRRGTLDILDAVAVQLPDVFYGEILPKLDLEATLNLAQVSKAYRDAVWSVGGVRSLEEKIEPHCVKIGKKVMTPLYWVALHSNMPAVRACLESGVDVNKVQVLILTKDIRTALHIAAELGHAAVVKALIEAGADVNKPSSPHDMDARGKSTGVLHNITYNKTPVYTAAAMGHTHVVMELIMAGADVNQATSKGVTSLYVAAQNGHEACVVSLIQAGADIHKAANNGWTPLAAAVYQKHKKVVAMLKHFGRA